MTSCTAKTTVFAHRTAMTFTTTWINRLRTISSIPRTIRTPTALLCGLITICCTPEVSYSLARHRRCSTSNPLRRDSYPLFVRPLCSDHRLLLSDGILATSLVTSSAPSPLLSLTREFFSQAVGVWSLTHGMSTTSLLFTMVCLFPDAYESTYLRTLLGNMIT